MKKSRIEKLIPIANTVLCSQYQVIHQEYLTKYNSAGNDKGKQKEAEKILDKAILRKEGNSFYIKSNYDGKISGFGVAVALSGLRPALAMYYNESGEVKTRPILEILAKIIINDQSYNSEIDALDINTVNKEMLRLSNEPNANDLVNLAIKEEMNNYLSLLKKYVLEVAIALKQVVRTYELK